MGAQLRLVIAASLLAGIPGARVVGQQANVTPSTPFHIEVNVDRVLVPIVVRDKKGRAVTDLKQTDFEVFDDGKPRPISRFTVQRYEAAPEGSAAVATTPPASAREAATAAGSTKSDDTVVFPARITVFLFDDMHLSFEDLAHAREAGSKVFADALTGTDMAAVVSISGRVNTGLTRDPAKLQDAIKSLVARAPYGSDAIECPAIGYYEADLIENKHDAVAIQDANQKFSNCNPSVGQAPGMNAGSVPNLPSTGASSPSESMVDSVARRALALGFQDVQNTYAAIANFINRLAPLPGQRTLILISPGLLNIEQDSIGMESRLINLAVKSNVTISALDARGLYTTNFSARQRSPSLRGQSLQVNSDYYGSALRIAENSMGELADGTGGSFFHNNNDLNAGLKALTEAPSITYLLELSLDGVKRNGTFHNLKVKVDREGLQLQARRGYFVPKQTKIKN